MIGWRGRLGFLLPPGNPTVETEMIELAPQGVSLHFQRMVARGVGGSLDGQSERNQMMIDHLDESVELLAMVNPDVIVIAHTATSYHLGRDKEAALLAKLQEASGIRVVTAFGSVSQALRRLGVQRLALGAPYSVEVTLQPRRETRPLPIGQLALDGHHVDDALGRHAGPVEHVGEARQGLHGIVEAGDVGEEDDHVARGEFS